MANFVGSSDSLHLFTEGAWGVVVDSEVNLVVASGASQVLTTSRKWAETEMNEEAQELASISLSALVASASGSSSKYTIPKTAQSEAKKALEWRKEHHRGGTPVGLNTARTLAKGGQIGIEKVRHIAKYFARHEVDKQGKGWKPSEDGFPSNGRIAWALWGGDTAWRWAQAIVDREEKKAVTAGGYQLNQAPVMGPELDDFDTEHEDYAPVFMTRVRLDGSGMDRLYKVDPDGSCHVWDDGSWGDLGYGKDGDIWNYDEELDYNDDECEKTHIDIDPASAVIIAARLYASPHRPVTIEEIDEVEAMLAKQAFDEIDWAFMDRTILAAGEVPAGATPVGDGVYTEEERAQNAQKQVRDKTGKFAKAGSRVIVGGDPNIAGKITRVNPKTGKVIVALDSGKSVEIDAKKVEGEKPRLNKAIPGKPVEQKRIDVSGILGEPRTPVNRSTASISGTLPAMTPKAMKDMLSNWPAWVKSQRDSFDPIRTSTPVAVKQKNSKDTGATGAKLKEQTGRGIEMDAYNHPLLSSWLNKKDSAGKFPNQLWYQPITAAGQAETLVDPDNTDVQPVYMAVVDPDDPRAVMALVSLVPASSTSTSPMVYKRTAGKWERDPKTLADLSSPTPPPVVPLDSETLNDVLKQVDESQGVEEKPVTASIALTVLFGNDAIVAAGGADRNRGNAEKLRRYWVRGEGAAKIRWGQGGDWKRCVRLLSKHMGVRAKGYCQLRHKEALGYYTSTHAKMDRAKNNAIAVPGEEDDMSVMDFTEVTEDDMRTPLSQIVSEIEPDEELSWEPEEEIVIILSDPEALDAEEFALIAAGGLDRNRGNAEELRRYWTTGKGGLKIRWGAKGDWTRCVRHLKKYMGPRAKGYCALRHKEMNHMWPGDRRNQTSIMASAEVTEEFIPVKSSERIIEEAFLRAEIAQIKRNAGILAGGAYEVNENTYKSEGAEFIIPLVIPEEMESGDGRKFKKGAIELRELPLPLLWQIKTGAGHDGSVVVGRIDRMERTENGIGNAHGVFDSGDYGQEAERLVREGFIRGVSADMDKFEAAEEVEEVAASEDPEDDTTIKKEKIVISKARVMAVTIVPKPAFQECKIFLVNKEETESPEEDEMIPDGIYVEDVDPNEAEAVVASGMIAGAIPTEPPAEWFENPRLNQPTPLTVSENGHVFGHIAAWNVDHIGMAFGTKPPRSRSGYAYFHTGVVRTMEGKDVPVGQITLAGGHADIRANAAQAVRHYDDTASAIIDCHAGEDQYGIWVAGALRPGTTPEQVRALRASAPSGDWRPIQGRLELVAVCQVNVPGFPIARAMVAGGQVTALVAAGASTLAKLRHNPMEDLAMRIAKLEGTDPASLLSAAEDARAKFNALMPQTQAEVEILAPAEDIYEEVEPTLVKSLEQILADVVAFSFRAQGYHWNVKGANFPQYHELFGEIYSDVHGSVDPIAENILKLGYDSPFNITTFANMSPLGTSTIESADCHTMAYDLYTANEHVINELKVAFQVANAANEQGIADYIAGRIDQHQKWSWQLKASAMPTEMAVLEDESHEEPYAEFFSAVDVESRFDRIAEFSAISEFAKFTDEQRKELAKKGEALPDGSFPIRNVADLKNAIKAYGRASLKDRPEVRKHIIQRAKDLGATDLVPEVWAEAKKLPKKKVPVFNTDMDDIRARLAEFSAKSEN